MPLEKKTQLQEKSVQLFPFMFLTKYIMSCPSCDIHNTLYNTKKSSVQPVAGSIPTSSRNQNQTRSPQSNEDHQDRTKKE